MPLILKLFCQSDPTSYVEFEDWHNTDTDEKGLCIIAFNNEGQQIQVDLDDEFEEELLQFLLTRQKVRINEDNGSDSV